jgi:putative membrane protein
MSRPPIVWALLAGVALAEIGYPLADGPLRARLVVATVVIGYAASVLHAGLTHGLRMAAALVAVTTGGGFAIEALGVATGFPFGRYTYSSALGPRPAGVSWVIPLAWTWMAWPAWLAASRLVTARPARIAVAAVALASWDLFLDPQMVAQGYWRWRLPSPALPGVPGIPLSNYLGWLGVAVLLMAALAAVTDARPASPQDAPMLALYLWTYASSVLAHAVFLGLAWSALWGGLGMGAVAVPLAVRLWLSRT